MPFSLLAVGDVHLGRRPLGLPEGFDPERFSPRAAWEAAVEEARRRKVDAVALLGDVVDQDRDFIEAYSPLARGVRALVDAGIRVVACVGNHDVAVLPRLAEEIRELRLIGRDGWEELELEAGDGDRVRLVGWSFPRARFNEDPSATLALRGRDGVATLGLVHGDLDASSSPHAPLSRARLVSAGFDAWLLGHVHKPTLESATDRIGYLGSLVGLDPGEPGVHGPWLVRVGGPGAVELEHLPLASIRWERMELPLAPEMDADAAESALLRALRARSADEHARWGSAELVAVRLSVTGRHPARHAIVERLRDGLGKVHDSSSLPLFVEKVEDRTRPRQDLDEIARQNHAAAALAKRLLALEGHGDPAERARLLRGARERLGQLASRPCFSALTPAEPADDELASALAREGYDLLERITESPGGPR